MLLRDAAIAERAIAERRFTDAAGLGDGFVQIQPAFGPWSAHAALSGPAETLDAAQRSLIQSTSLALIGCGRASTALTVAERLAAADPYDERSACIMLVALAALGRGTEALRRLDVVRRSLADDIGALIGPQMRDVESALLDGLDAFDVLLPGPPDGPVAPYGAPGVDRAAAAVPALVRPFEHPLLDEFFVGRDVELKR